MGIWGEQKTEKVSSKYSVPVNTIKCVVVEYSGNGSGHVQIMTQDLEKLGQVTKQLNAGELEAWDGTTKKVAAVMDGAYYRAQIMKQENDHVTVSFIDFGQQDQVKTIDIRALPSGLPLSMPAQATPFKLSFVDTPGLRERQGKESCRYFMELVGQDLIMANVDNESNGVVELTMFPQEMPEEDSIVDTSAYNEAVNMQYKWCVNALMVKEGLGTLDQFVFDVLGGKSRAGVVEAKEMEIIKCLEVYQEEAKRRRRGLWEFGDYLEYGGEGRRE